MRLPKLAALGAALLIYPACGANSPPAQTLSSAGKKVVFVPESQLGAFCEYEGLVRSEQGANFRSLESNIKAAENDVRNKAARQGITHLVIMNHGKDQDQATWASAGGSGQCQNCVTLEASGYYCP